MRGIRCECPETGKLNPEWESVYDQEVELPFVNHEPGKCKCTNGLRLYSRNGNLLYLCSNCHTLTFGDELIQESET